MKASYILRAACCCLTLLPFTACEEQEVEVFSAEQGINFLTVDGYGNFTDDYENLQTDYNFYTAYVEQGLDVTQANLQIGVQIEGTLGDQPVNVRLKVMADEDYELANVVLPADSLIEAGGYRRTLTVKLNKPAEYDKEYRAILTFDYEAGNLVPGTKERQEYLVKVKDTTDWTSMEVDNEEEWNANFSSILGEYGPVKVRFILATLGAAGRSYTSIGYLYYYTLYYPAYGFSSVIDQLKQALQEYNDTHDQPLSEPDGRAVAFN